MPIIAPSILAANYLNLGEDINKINQSKAMWIHFDVMDSHFVPNLTFGPDIFKVFKDNSHLFLDVHIMVSNPKFVSELYIKAGADQIVFHYEACESDEEVQSLIHYIKSQKIKVGLAIKPNTDVLVLQPFLKDLDLVLVMSVEPGFGGQSFNKNALLKARYFSNERKTNNFQYLIQIDGGIDNTNKEACYEAGIDVLVAGSYLFKQTDFSKAVESLL